MSARTASSGARPGARAKRSRCARRRSRQSACPADRSDLPRRARRVAPPPVRLDCPARRRARHGRLPGVLLLRHAAGKFRLGRRRLRGLALPRSHVRNEVVEPGDIRPLPGDRGAEAGENDQHHRELGEAAIGPRRTRLAVFFLLRACARRMRSRERCGRRLFVLEYRRTVRACASTASRRRATAIHRRRSAARCGRAANAGSSSSGVCCDACGAVGIAGVARRLCRPGAGCAEIVDFIDERRGNREALRARAEMSARSIAARARSAARRARGASLVGSAGLCTAAARTAAARGVAARRAAAPAFRPAARSGARAAAALPARAVFAARAVAARGGGRDGGAAGRGSARACVPLRPRPCGSRLRATAARG